MPENAALPLLLEVYGLEPDPQAAERIAAGLSGMCSRIIAMSVENGWHLESFANDEAVDE
ncbi:hypothetical protein [Nitratireductor indicus]|uniref:hypothetical protein n=1 Tax=Nitratireductor indicus TaxID=721133 RepID=UPI0002EBB645|nr:hypothetical protein [Nitratireductor indicus]MDS1137114.1 hypothetical protein [Nitratireductor indicus]SFQ24353.1 hypothetical protein SAMN05216176_10279 [Nitratireductor indicus]